MGRIRIGVSGWSYDSWRERFYPGSLAGSERLSYVADEFDAVEANGTFYGLLSPTTFARWYGSAPRGFRFALKGSRFITHNKKLRDVDAALANFFASGVLELDDKLGPFLWQLSEKLHFDAERIESFLKMLPRDTSAAASLARRHDDRVDDVSYGPGAAHRLRHVLEVRHKSCFCEDLVAILRRTGVALAFSHSSRWPYYEEITAGFVYLRLHGPDELYESPYADEDLQGWADRIETWRKSAQPEDARTVTDRTPPQRKERDVYVFFDNDKDAHAPRNAMSLRDVVGDS